MRKWVVGIIAGAFVLAAGVSVWMLRPDPVVAVEPFEVPEPTADQIDTVAGARIFFAHQSVGESLIDALPSLSARAGTDAPRIARLEGGVPSEGGVLIETMIGRNGDPLGKVAEFDRVLRAGLADTLDVALLKLCFVDVHAGVDVHSLFESYRDTMSGLERDFPDVTFVYATVPLMHERDLFIRAKRVLGRGGEFDPIHNVVREQLNAMIRAEYAGTGRLFDVAKAEAAGKSGQVEVLGADEGVFLSLRSSLATDSGHLTDEGATLIGGALVVAVADSLP